MQVTETSAEGLKREYRVVVPADEIDGKIAAKLEELQRTVRLDGFRPGKVPLSILRQRYGASVMGEVLEGVVGETSQRALTDQGVRPALAPKIDVKAFGEGADLEYDLSVEALPEIEPPDLAKHRFSRLRATVAEAKVQEALEGLAERNKTFNEVDTIRESRAGDMLVIDFKGSVDGVPLEGAAGEGVRIELGASPLLPGFDEQLIGAKVGEHRSLTITLPDTYPEPASRGKQAIFEVEVKQLLEPEKPEVDDALAAVLGFADLAALRSAVREQLEREYEARSRFRLKREVLDRLAENHDFAVPEGMVERELESIWAQVEEDMKAAGTTWETADQTEEEARADYRAIAERRVRLGLLLSEVGRRNKITVPQDELNRAVMEQARRFPGKEQEVFAYFGNDPEAMNELHAPLFEEKVIDFILEMAEVTDKAIPVEELMRDPDEADDASDVGAEAAKKAGKAAGKAKSARPRKAKTAKAKKSETETGGEAG